MTVIAMAGDQLAILVLSATSIALLVAGVVAWAPWRRRRDRRWRL